MKPSGGFCPSRASLRMRVPDINSKSSCLREKEWGKEGEEQGRGGEKKNIILKADKVAHIPSDFFDTV